MVIILIIRTFFPRLYFQSKEPNTIIVLEDLDERNIKRLSQELNLENTKVVINKLAKFHAATYYMENEVY